jgi:hypothetical protein
MVGWSAPGAILNDAKESPPYEKILRLVAAILFRFPHACGSREKCWPWP